MKALQKVVIAVLLGVWFFPAVGSAAQPARPAAQSSSSVPASPPAGATATAPLAAAASSETSTLATREQQSPQLQDFRGGGVSIYIGSGVLLVLVIVLLIIAL